MLKRRAIALAAAWATAAALLVVSDPAGADHGTAPDGKAWSADGYTYETRTVVLPHTHVNHYRCDIAWCRASGSVKASGARNATTTTSCDLELFTTRKGCGHNGGDWTFTGVHTALWWRLTRRVSLAAHLIVDWNIFQIFQDISY